MLYIPSRRRKDTKFLEGWRDYVHSLFNPRIRGKLTGVVRDENLRSVNSRGALIWSVIFFAVDSRIKRSLCFEFVYYAQSV